MKNIFQIFTSLLFLPSTATLATYQSCVPKRNISDSIVLVEVPSKHPKTIEQNTKLIKQWIRQSNLQFPSEIIRLIRQYIPIGKRAFRLLLNKRIMDINSFINPFSSIKKIKKISNSHNLVALHAYFNDLNRLALNISTLLIVESIKVSKRIDDKKRNESFLVTNIIEDVNEEIDCFNEKVLRAVQYYKSERLQKEASLPFLKNVQWESCCNIL